MRSSRIHLTIAFSNLACLGLTITERTQGALPVPRSEFIPLKWMDWAQPLVVNLNGRTLCWKKGSREPLSSSDTIVIGTLAALPGHAHILLSQDTASIINSVRPEPRRNSWQPAYFPSECSKGRRAILKSATVHFPKGR